MGAERGAETADEEESLASRNGNRRRWHDSLYKWRLRSTAERALQGRRTRESTKHGNQSTSTPTWPSVCDQGAGILLSILVDQGVRGVQAASYGLELGTPVSHRQGWWWLNVHTVAGTVVHEIAAEACQSWRWAFVGETVGAWPRLGPAGACGRARGGSTNLSMAVDRHGVSLLRVRRGSTQECAVDT